MRPLAEFLSDLRSLGIMLSANGERLVCNAPKNTVTDEIRKELAARKADILAFLRDTQALPVSLEEVPLSHSQQRLWFINQLDPENPVYNVVISLWITGELNRDALELALSTIVERHESLRTGFFERNGQPFANIVDAVDWKMAFVDLSHLASREPGSRQAEAEAERLARIEVRRPFNLERPPLLRATLLKVSRRKALLVSAVHHIVADGWSLGIFSHELTQLYAAFSNGQPSPLAKLPFQFRDYVRWEQDAGRKAGDRQIPYWLERLGGELPVLELPVDRRRPLAQTFNGKRIPILIDEPLAQCIRNLGRETRTTVFMVLLAAFQALLFRYTGIEDILVGSGTANRQHQEFSTLIGFFVNTLVLRNGLSGDLSFVELLKRVQETAIAAYSHQDVPFERLVETLRPERALNHSPLVQVMFTFQNLPMPELHFAGITAEIAEIDPGIARAELSVEVWPQGQGYRCDFEYNTDLFDERTIRQLQAHYLGFLEAVAADPALAIGRVPLLAKEEREQLLTTWNRTESVSPRLPVHDLFAEWVRLTPNAIALSTGEGTVSYRQLDAMANAIAHRLLSAGVAPRSFVAVCAGSSAARIAAFLGILKAGAAYLPLDPQSPAARLAYMIEDAAPAVLLADRALAGKLPSSLPILMLEEIVAVPGEGAPPAGVQVDDPAYLMYTSGSTGKPKGVVIPHRGIARLARGADYCSFSRDEVFLQLTRISFDVSTLEIWGALLNGARLVLLPDGEHSPEEINLAIRAHGVTTVCTTSSLCHFIIDERIETFAPLRKLLVGGDVLSVAHARKLLEYAPGLSLLNCYGPTENTTWTSGHIVRMDESLDNGAVPIGKPIRNTRIYILDGFGQPVPIGVSGELCTAGDGVALGYLNSPELTAEKFVTLDLGQFHQERVYRTGDIARYRSGGAIEFLGRKDNQVKIRDFRIELGEIEARIAEEPGIREAVVIAREDPPGNKRLVAYYTAADTNTVEVEALREHLALKLPKYMVPAAFVEMESLPLTPNGKLDRKALPAPEESMRERGAAMIAPRNQMEQTLARIWSDALQVAPIGIRDNFFDLGGHSLLLTKVHARLRQELHSNLALLDLFRYPTVESLAKAILEESASPAATTSSASQPAIQGLEHPLSRSQQRLWFLDRLNPGSPVYNLSFPLRLKGNLSRQTLERALKALLDRHESLRTSFLERDGIPYARVERAEDWEMRFVDLSDIALDCRDEELRRYVEEEAGRPFALERGPLFRASLVRTAQQDHALILVVHHIVFDGWSSGILAGELVELLRASLEGRDPVLPPLRLQFRDFVAWEGRQEAARNLQMEYWKKQLAGELPLLDLPTDYQRPPLQSFRGGRSSIVIPKQLAGRLQRLGREQDATLFMVLVAAFNVLLLRYSRQEDILVGTPTAGRLQSEFESLIGLFVNSLVLRTDLGGNPTFVELVRRVRTTALDAFQYQDVPFDQLVKELQPERGLDRSPIFQVLFSLQNLPLQKVNFAGLEMSVLEFQASLARYDLAVDIYAFEDGYSCDFEYSTDLFEEETVRQMQRHYLRLLEAVAEDADRPIASLPLLDAAEHRLILVDWNGTESASPGYATVVEWFGAQAAATPEATAVGMGGHSLSYAELDRQSSLLADGLRKRGVGREVVVGLYVSRSFNMVVGLLGILKAGGAYLPLDPAFPDERIEFLLRDGNVALILTEASLKAALPESHAALLALDEAWEESPAAALHSSDEPPGGEDLAYLIYTSGSTGEPKGTEIRHGALVNLLASMLREPGLRKEDTLVAVTTLSFDIAGLEIFGPLVCGARLVLASREQAQDPQALAELLDRAGGTVMQATPSTWRMLVESGWMGKPDLRMWCGGEALSPDLAESLLARGGELWNMYGPTETTIWSAAHRVSRGEDPIPIGRPIANTQMYILDAQGEPVPIGVAGELYIAGDGVGRGYWKRPELTGTRFVPDPFSRQANRRMYRTGDLARYRRDGQIQWLGRTDQQIKLRGYRIELGEIEAVIERHPEVRQAVVAVNGQGSGQRLIAYVKQVEDALAIDLRAWLQQRLPEYMVPSMFIALPELPHTLNGKVDRKRLPAPDESAREHAAVSVVPRNRMERTLARIWSDVLRVSPVGVRDNFFDLGGQSLLLIEVHAKLRRELDADVPVVDLFRYPTIESMAAHLDRRHQAVVAEEVNS